MTLVAASPATERPVSLAEDRFDRFRRISWWDQDKLRQARVLIVGAGALGNELVKNLGLLGVGSLVIVDMDCIEESNLSRSVLFRSRDAGRPKAEVAAAAARDLYPDLRIYPLVANVIGEVGLGWFRWADVVAGALDNREARLFVNSTCAALGRPWIDGGIEVLNGVVRGFDPPATACYECTMSEVDWEQVNLRRGCSLLARQAAEAGGAPTTPTTASVIGAMQAQEVVKRIHGLASLSGAGFVFEGLYHNSYQVSYPRNPDCPWHEPPPKVEAVDAFSADTPLGKLWNYAAERLGGLDALDLARELVLSLRCPKCERTQPIHRPACCIRSEQVLCEACGEERIAEFAHSIAEGSPHLEMTARQFGLPAWDIVWARRGEAMLGMELAGDGVGGRV